MISPPPKARSGGMGPFGYAERARALAADRTPFVVATVIRVRKPASARPGDAALVLQDGTIEGFVGGACAQSTVRSEAIRAMGSGEPVVLKITPGVAAGEQVRSAPGTVEVSNPCLSGGEMEIFLEPVVAPPLVVVHGHGPVAQALVDGASWAGFEATEGTEETCLDGVSAVVVAAHGGDEAGLITQAARAGVAYIGLVASRARGGAVVEATDLDHEARSRVFTPAGLDIGARGPEHIAVSIFAEIVSVLAKNPPAARAPSPEGEGPRHAKDPVCGMVVPPGPPSAALEVSGVTVWFCCKGCLDAYALAPGEYPHTP